MPSVIDQFVAGLNHIADVDSPVLEDFCDDSPLPVSPHAALFLICAVRHFVNRRSIETLLKKRIFSKPKPAGQLRQYEGRRIYIPGYPHLECEVSSVGINVHERVSGTHIWTDLASGHDVTAYDLIANLESFDELEFPEQRLLSLHPSKQSLLATVNEFDDDDRNSLSQNFCDDGIEFESEEDPLIKAWLRVEKRLDSQEVRFCLAALFNDAAFLLEEFNADELDAEWLRRNQEHLTERRRWLHELLKDERRSPYVLHALSDIDDPELERVIETNLRSNRLKGDAYTNEQREALAIVRTRRMSSLYPVVRELVQLHGPRGTSPRLRVWISGLETLLEAGEFLPEMLQELESPPGDLILAAAELSLLYAPHLSRELFRNAIETDKPRGPESAAGVLAILDESWGHEVLLKLMEETDDRRVLHLCHYALLESRDHGTHGKADRILAVRLSAGPKSSKFKKIDFGLFHQIISSRSKEIFPLRGRVK